MAAKSNCVVITVCQNKGGVGKSALAVNLAHALALRQSAPVLLVDADPDNPCAGDYFEERAALSDVLSGKQGILAPEARPGLHVMSADDALLAESPLSLDLWPRMEALLGSAQSDYRAIIVDCAKGWSGATPYAVRATLQAAISRSAAVSQSEGYCLLPFKSGYRDARSAWDTQMVIVREIQSMARSFSLKPHRIKALLAQNVLGVRCAWKKSEFADELCAEISAFGLKPVDAVFPYSNAYDALAATGKTLFDKTDKAAPEWQRTQRRAYNLLIDELLKA